MRILYINGEYPFCYYYRGYLPGLYSDQMVVTSFMRRDMRTDGPEMTRMAESADVLVFQRPTKREQIELAAHYKRLGKKIIFENDDTYKGIPLERLNSDKAVEIAKDMQSNIEAFLRLSDGVIASTDTLAREYAELNPNVAVLKNCIDPMDEFPRKPNETGMYRVGIIGSVTTNDDYEHIKADLKALDERGDVTIVVMGVKHKDGKVLPSMEEDAAFWNSLKNVEWHPYCHVTEYMKKVSDLALDLAIIPRKDHYFNECKSNLKFLEMSLLGIPVLAQSFPSGKSPYQGEDEPYLWLAGYDEGEWYQKIVAMLESPKEMNERAQKAKKYVLQNYNIETYASEWTNTIQRLCKLLPGYTYHLLHSA